MPLPRPTLANRAWNIFRKAGGYRFPRSGLFLHKVAIALTPRRMTVDLFPGIAVPLDLNDETQRATYWQGSRFETPTPQILAFWGVESTLFFDIGSNYGFFSYFMLSGFPAMEAYSFEPNPATFALVEHIREHNHLSRLHPNHMGLGDVRAELDLHPGQTDSGHSTFGAHPGLHGAVVRIPVLPFDEWLETSQLHRPVRPQWIAKIDVEGFEAKVLRGMTKSLEAKLFRGIAIEVNEFTLNICGSKPSDIFELMRSHGYVPLSDLESEKNWPLHKTANSFFVPAGFSR